MICNRDQAFSAGVAIINVISIHSPLVALLNILLWGYVLPHKWLLSPEKTYA